MCLQRVVVCSPAVHALACPRRARHRIAVRVVLRQRAHSLPQPGIGEEIGSDWLPVRVGCYYLCAGVAVSVECLAECL